MLIAREFFTRQWVKVLLSLVVIPQAVQTYNAWVNNSPWLLTFSLLAIVSIVSIFLGISSMTKWLSQKPPTICEGRALRVSRKGIIFTLGRQSHKEKSPVLKVLKAQNPELYAFLGTPETFADNAVKQIAEQANLKPEQLKEGHNSPTDMEAIRIATINMVQWMMQKGLKQRDIVVDITGGMVPMSLAAYMGASQMGVDVQYTSSEYGKDNKPIDGKQRALLICMQPIESRSFAEEQEGLPEKNLVA